MPQVALYITTAVIQVNMWKIIFKKVKQLKTLTMWKGWDFMGTHCDICYVLYKELSYGKFKEEK